MTHFTTEQLEEIGLYFGLVPKESLPVRDGRVLKNTQVWWWSVAGPELVSAESDWENIKKHPQLYSLKKPKCKVTYQD
jgi:hypothetical protein